MTKKNILFLTGTRADFGKLRSLIEHVDKTEEFEFSLFVTGMHTSCKYGYTVNEVYKAIDEQKLSQGPHSVYTYMNQTGGEPMEQVLANTIAGLSRYVTEFRPDLIVVHGDRVEALAGAIVGALQNIYVAHVEGGERSGTVDELIRHAVTKLSHIHFVANDEAAQRLKQLGEREDAIYIIGSPDIDMMVSPHLPDLTQVQKHYQIPFNNYAIMIFHPVTTALDQTAEAVSAMVDAALEDNENYIVIYPNNDKGSDIIFTEYKRLEDHPRFRFYPSLRFPSFLTLLKNSLFIIGNSSAGVREAPVYGTPSINIGTRQQNRFSAKSLINIEEPFETVTEGIQQVKEWPPIKPSYYFGEGRSAENFLTKLRTEALWQTPKQKQFIDLDLHKLIHETIGKENKKAAESLNQ